MPHLLEPISSVQVDVVGPLYRTRRYNYYLVTIIDKTTRFSHAAAVRKVSSSVIIRVLKEFFYNFGYSYRIKTDGVSYV